MADYRETEGTLPGATPPGHALPGGPDFAAGAPAGGMVPADHRIPAETGPSHPGPAGAAMDADTARQEIVRTRARLSETIDQIEEQLLLRKERLQSRLDVKGQLRERLSPVNEFIQQQPWAALGGVVTLGLALGYLTGGSDGEETHPPRGTAALWAGEEAMVEGRGRWRSRARRWEARSRELMRLNQQLHEEVRQLRAELDEESGDLEDEGWMGAVAGAVGSLFGRGATRTESLMELTEDDLPGEYHPSASYDQFAESQRVRQPDDPLQA